MRADDVAAALESAPGVTAAELAVRLGAESEGQVSFLLYADHRRFRCEMGPPPRWSLVLPSGGARRTGAGPPAAPAGQLPLGQDMVGQGRLGLYAWQADALAAWARAGRRGVVEAVTGTGKTMVGVAAALGELARRGQVLVLVPTVELAHQWVATLGPRLGPGHRVGRLGAGSTDSLASHDVLVAVVNSARAVDVRPIRQGGLLVADECHRYGSAVNRLGLDGRFGHRLGLSATYARGDGGNEAWLDPYFGGTCFRLGYARALADEVTAHFSVALVGVRFSPEEWECYDELSKVMAQTRARLVDQYGLPDEPFEAFLAALGVLADGDGEGAVLARRYRQAMLERRALLADTPAKDEALVALAPAVAEADRTIVFTQTIPAAERASAALGGRGLRAGAVHSALAGADRRRLLGRFAAGGLDVLVAPRVLDEGVDVPAADLAVIAGASRSRRQMIQRMGRVLRRKADGRRARFAILFVEGTVEDPAHGAHEAFLDEIVGVADDVSCFRAGAVTADPDGPRRALRPSWPAAGTVSPRMAGSATAT
ncbi:MAG: DEAD/DEAH box helicase [Acidimicrobiales bacterium]